MRLLVQIVAFLFVGTGLGYCTADYAMKNGLQTVSVTHGPWVTWPAVASPAGDPYTRAHFAEIGKFGLTAFEAVIYRARTDSEGRRLRDDCSYSVSGNALPARWWSVTVYDADGKLVRNRLERYSFNNLNMWRAPDGSYRVRLSKDATTGNWLPTEGAGEFQLVLRLYNADQNSAASLDSRNLPTIVREACA